MLDYDEKIRNSKCKEEADVWKFAKRTNYQPPEGWVCGCFQQSCGHYEILQHPIWTNHQGVPQITEAKALDILRKDSETRKCSSCICGR